MKSINEYISEFEKFTFDPKVHVEDELPESKGLYVICVQNFDRMPNQLKDLKFEYFQKRPVLYLGISGSRGLRKRDYKNHFTGTARTSTLRKSLGVLFELNKVQNDKEKGTTKYKFTTEEENKLTEWMKENLIMHYCVTNDDVEIIETELIEYFNPPLNISKNYSEINREFRKRLSKLRCEIK